MNALRRFLRRLAAPFRSTHPEHELAREFRWIGDSRLDFKLGARMLVKYPGLSLVGGIGLAAAIAIGTSGFAMLYAYLYATLPLDDGDRVVALENWNIEINNEERRSLHDLVDWRRELRTVEDLSAFRNVGRNLIVPGGANEPVQVAELTASSFTLARVSPLLGRPLLPDDEQPGATPVLVIGHDVWQSRFGGDAAVIGREVRLGSTVHTIVGVMPAGFKFPVNHGYWVPLRIDLSAFGRRQGPAVFVFGRLAPGAGMADAQTELTAIGDRASAQFPDTHARLEPRVMPYAHPIMDIQGMTAWEFAMMEATMSMLLLIVAVNLGILVYARTATRHGEIAIRTALGATRRRIVGQLFVEALVLAGLAAAAGLVLSQFGLRLGHQLMKLEGAQIPYWIDDGIPPATYVYLAAVTVLTSVITGVIPALRATGRRVQNSLRELGGSSGLQLGRTWTALIVAQVALTVAGLPVTIANGWNDARAATTRPAFEVERFIVAPFRLDPEPPPNVDPSQYRRELASRFENLHTDFAARVEAEPEVSDVTMAAAIPGNEAQRRVEFDSGELTILPPTVHVNHVAEDFFDAFDAAMLTGRRLSAADRTGNAVVVNRAFVRRVLNDGPALGRRLRYRESETATTPPTPAGWHEVVGVVEDLQTNSADSELVDPVVYHPLDTRDATVLTLIVRARGGDAAALAPRLRDILIALDPTARITPRPMLDLYRQMDLALRIVALVLALIIISVLLLSAAGVYALMSFTVSQRRKEIGIRAAMGADARRLLVSVFSRAAGQLGAGVIGGIALAVGLEVASSGDALGRAGLAALPVVAVTMVIVGLLATLGPARRGLRIHPIEALREP